MRASALALGAAATLAALSVAGAQEKPGRYSMSPAEGGGFARLDTQTGQMSLCNRKDNQWACQDMADQGRGLADEVERLRNENRELRAEIRKMEDIMLGDGKPVEKPGESRAERRPDLGSGPPVAGLPSEQDVDRAMTYIQRMLKKFKEKLKELEETDPPKRTQL